jgi:hypothetical protein
MSLGSRLRLALFAIMAFGCAAMPALASPWAEVGDNQLRADIELLAAAGMVDDATIHWPLPWESILAELNGASLARQPIAVRAAARRVLAKGQAAAPGLSAALSVDLTNSPATVYGFDGMGRGQGQGQLSLEANGSVFSGRLSVGAISQNFGGQPNKLMLDGTYLSARLGGVRVYAGYLDHWWGPGQISALQLSNNARPMPQIGIERASTAASSWPVLNWLGPWQFEFLLGTMDGPQIQSNVYYNAAHFTFSPLQGLEIGLAKTEQFCGDNHPCSPLRDYFQNIDFSTHANNVNGEGSLEIKYGHALWGVPVQAYLQLMNEDYSLFTHSGTSHLFGASMLLPTTGNPVKLTLEFTDTLARLTAFDFGNPLYGFTYTDNQYPDGMRYRGRTLGFSLDNDSTLWSLQSSWTDAADRFYELTFHHAAIGNARSAGVNIVSPVPVLMNVAEARVALPVSLGDSGFKLDLAARLQDDQPRPKRGFEAAVEAALRIGL